jgi:hypothetical protein
MRRTALVVLLATAFAGAACQSQRDFVIERERPFELAEPVYLLKPSELTVSDLMAVWMPRPAPKSPGPVVPLATVRSIGPENTTAPQLASASGPLLRRIVAELPGHLPRRAVFLVSGRGEVVEVAFKGVRDTLNERVFAARLRALRFKPATHQGRPIAVVCELDLMTGAIPPNTPR